MNKEEDVGGLKFYGRCFKDAWRSSWDLANVWLPLIGIVVLYGALRLTGHEPVLPDFFERNTLALAAAYVIAAWLVVFAVRLIAAPPRLYAELHARPPVVALPAPLLALPGPAPVAAPVETPAETLSEALAPVAAPKPAPAPILEVRLHDQIHETAMLDAIGEKMPAARAYVARVTNRSGKTVHRCQLFVGNPTHIQVVSGPFDLDAGQQRDLPVLRVIDQSDEPHALAYYLESETWQVAAGQAAWLPDPGRFKIKVLSADAPTASLQVDLACSTTKPEAWTLVEAAPRAERRKRERAGWSGAGAVVAEPNSGD
jgi:hypothetical protein